MRCVIELRARNLRSGWVVVAPGATLLLVAISLSALSRLFIGASSLGAALGLFSLKLPLHLFTATLCARSTLSFLRRTRLLSARPLFLLAGSLLGLSLEGTAVRLSAPVPRRARSRATLSACIRSFVVAPSGRFLNVVFSSGAPRSGVLSDVLDLGPKASAVHALNLLNP
jgi:hypothetical protein